jgi:hypothetical protein
MHSRIFGRRHLEGRGCARLNEGPTGPPCTQIEHREKGTQMPDDEFIQKLAAALAAHLQPQIPVSIDLWDVAMIARVLKRSETQVRNRLTCLPDFPKAIRLPVAGGGRGQPLYRATEVLKWVSKYQDKN